MRVKRSSICFVIPYFGEFPFWMDYFIESCSSNSSVDYVIYSDNPLPKGWPANITYHYISFDDYKNLVSQRLGIRFNPINPYKLCDLKPAYGMIHDNDIKGYDFWGFCDIDLIFGNIRKFLTHNVLNSCDFYSAYERRVSGHFFLTRNTPELNKSFMKVDGWRKVFEDVEHHCFDERAFSSLFVKFKNHPAWSKNILSWLFLPLSRRSVFEEQYSTPGLRYNWVDGTRDFPTEWYWRDGALTNNASDREFLYFHFLKWKRNWGGKNSRDAPTSIKWMVDDSGFHSA
mgnify:CR=1 FL=1